MCFYFYLSVYIYFYIYFYILFMHFFIYFILQWVAVVSLVWEQDTYSPAAPNHVPWRAESMQVFIPTNHYTSWFHQLVPSSLVEGVLIS